MKLRRLIQDYFSFTKNERIGLIILIGLILVLIAVNQIIFHFETPGRIDLKKFEQLVAMLKEQDARKVGRPRQLFVFDPNRIDSLQLDSLMLPTRIKQNLLKYRAKGGHFYRSEDLKKLYGMNDSIYKTIEDFIQIASIIRNNQNVPEVSTDASLDNDTDKRSMNLPAPKKPVVIKIEINRATAQELETLYGIGPVLSKRIVKYRKLLGGFSDLEQLHEVYGLKPETIEKVLPYLILEDALLEKINVNFAEADELAKHPYISWELANKIVKFRSVEGFINDLESMRIKGLIDESDYQRISPYMKTKN